MMKDVNSQESLDRQMMMRAIRLAGNGLYTCSPNPRVGCVICKDGKIIAQGWHQYAGEAHAEVRALQQLAAGQARGSTVYVSLEPCSHTGKTGPCADALIEAGVARVVCAMQDPSPQVSGAGLQMLREAGIVVESGLLENEARKLNPGFIKRMEKGLPYIRIKMAMSLDGRTALANGASQWITGESARQDVHRWRARSDLILTGSETVLRDNPRLTARLAETLEVRQALRCVIDSRGRVPAQANIFSSDADTVIAGITEEAGWQIDRSPQGKIDLFALMTRCAHEEINEIWLESGPSLAGAMVEAGLVDELIVYMAPVLLGDSAMPLLRLTPFEHMRDRLALQLKSQRQLGDDQRFIFTRG